jgi:hypothetical protein
MSFNSGFGGRRGGLNFGAGLPVAGTTLPYGGYPVGTTLPYGGYSVATYPVATVPTVVVDPYIGVGGGYRREWGDRDFHGGGFHGGGHRR